MTTLIDRIKARRQELNWSQAKLAEKLGWPQSRIGNYESGVRGIKENALKEIASVLGVTPDWLRYGDGEPNPVTSNVKDTGGFELWDRHTPLGDDEIEVPFYKDIRMAAGNGFADDIEDYNNFKLRFSKATLRRQGVQYENAVCVVADGNSMEPAIPNGATVGIDRGNTVIKDGQIYAINHGGLLRIKLLYKLPNERVRIKSYNEEEHPEEEADLADITVVGKVFWYSVLL
ncbi:helix-turn-helix transcriptional regulator [Pasteurellaceae bacterium TAE3-ERU1]|nr:helix-turn-helix transcriptional regulator [Pasteurellaceae bacterium TAE3-ERU1]